MRSHRDLNSGRGIHILRDSGAVGRVGESFQALAEQPLGGIHSTKIPTGPGPLQKVDPFFRNFSGWTEPIQWVLDWNFLKFWLSGSRPLSSDFKQTISIRLSECWLLTGQKMLCVIVPSRQLASPEFFSCVPTRQLLSRILVRFVHRGCACNSQGKLSLSNLLNRNEGAIDDSWKHFGCYQRDHSNLHRENSVSDRSQGIVNNIYEGHDRRKFEYIV